MIRKSNYSKIELYQRVGEAVRVYQESTEAFDEAAADSLGLNRTDLKCLGVIYMAQNVSAGAIAQATGLTKGAMTTALDRLEKAGYAARVRDPNDRRGVLLELTQKGRESIDALWGHFRDSGPRLLSKYDEGQLEAILDFLTEAKRLQDEHTERVLAGTLKK